MPIVNGQYVYSSLGSPKDVQTAVFGDYSKRDMVDMTEAAYNYMMHQQDQAYAYQMWQLQNKYNSPASQMERYKEAGLNPNLIYSQQQASAGFNPPSTPAFHSSGAINKGMNTALNVIGQIKQIVEAAAGVSSTISQNKLRNAQTIESFNRGSNITYNNMKAAYDIGTIVDPESSMYLSPYAEQQRTQLQAQRAKIEQLKAATSLIPDQKERQKALTDLEKYRLDVMRGQNDAVLNIHTGNEGLDSFFKLISYFLLNQSYW